MTAVHQAVFGCLPGRGHGRIAASGPIDSPDLAAVYRITDLAVGRTLERPAVACEILPGGRTAIVFARLDPAPPGGRAGALISHVFLIPTEEIVKSGASSAEWALALRPHVVDVRPDAPDLPPVELTLDAARRVETLLRRRPPGVEAARLAAAALAAVRAGAQVKVRTAGAPLDLVAYLLALLPAGIGAGARWATAPFHASADDVPLVVQSFGEGEAADRPPHFEDLPPPTPEEAEDAAELAALIDEPELLAKLLTNRPAPLGPGALGRNLRAAAVAGGAPARDSEEPIRLLLRVLPTVITEAPDSQTLISGLVAAADPAGLAEASRIRPDMLTAPANAALDEAVAAAVRRLETLELLPLLEFLGRARMLPGHRPLTASALLALRRSFESRIEGLPRANRELLDPLFEYAKRLGEDRRPVRDTVAALSILGGRRDLVKALWRDLVRPADRIHTLYALLDRGARTHAALFLQEHRKLCRRQVEDVLLRIARSPLPAAERIALIQQALQTRRRRRRPDPIYDRIHPLLAVHPGPKDPATLYLAALRPPTASRY